MAKADRLRLPPPKLWPDKKAHSHPWPCFLLSQAKGPFQFKAKNLRKITRYVSPEGEIGLYRLLGLSRLPPKLPQKRCHLPSGKMKLLPRPGACPPPFGPGLSSRACRGGSCFHGAALMPACVTGAANGQSTLHPLTLLKGHVTGSGPHACHF